MDQIFIQSIGIIALIFWVISIQSTDKKKILKLQNIANAFYAIQYILLNAISAGAMNIVAVIRGIVLIKNDKKDINNSNLVLIIFCIIIIIIGIITYDKWYSVIPIIIALIYTYATFQKNTKIIRIAFLITSITWIVYNLIVKAYAPLLGNIVELFSGIVSIVKYDILKENEEKANH